LLGPPGGVRGTLPFGNNFSYGLNSWITINKSFRIFFLNY